MLTRIQNVKWCKVRIGARLASFLTSSCSFFLLLTLQEHTKYSSQALSFLYAVRLQEQSKKEDSKAFQALNRLQDLDFVVYFGV